MYSSSTAANGSGSCSGARPRRRRGRAVVFSEADPASWPPRFCAFSVATPEVYFREGNLSEVSAFALRFQEQQRPTPSRRLLPLLRTSTLGLAAGLATMQKRR